MIIEEKPQKTLFNLCWIFYFTSYLGRYNYSGIMAELINKKFFTEAMGGFIATSYFASYSFGQIINGYFSGKVKPEKLLCSGLLGSAICNLLMALLDNYNFMVVIWFINGFFQSMTWSPIVAIFIKMFPKEKRSSYFVSISSSIAFGTLFAYFFTSVTLALGGWKLSFIFPSLILATVALGGFIIYNNLQKYNVEDIEDEVCVEVEPDKGQKNNMKSPLIIIIIIFFPTVIYGMLKDGITAWIPTLLFQNFHVSTTISTGFAMILPIINLSGAYMAKYVYVKLKGNDLKSASLFFAMSAISLTLLYYFKDVNILLTALLLALITSSMMANNIIIISFIPMGFAEGGKSSFISGLLNSTGYLGAALSSLGIGFLAINFSWSTVILFWLLATVLASLICFLFSKII